MHEPDLDATVIMSDMLHGFMTLRAIKDGKPIRFEFVLEDSGFVPGDIVKLVLLDDYNRLVNK